MLEPALAIVVWTPAVAAGWRYGRYLVGAIVTAGRAIRFLAGAFTWRRDQELREFPGGP